MIESFLHWLSRHGISPMLPFAVCAMIAGGCLVVLYRDISAKRIRKKTKEGDTMIDWKKQAADELSAFEARKESLQNLQERIETLSIQIHSLNANQMGESVKGGSGEDMLLSKFVELEELKKQHTITRKYVELTQRCLNALTQEERLILERFYIYRTQGWAEDLMEELNIERTAVYKRKDDALRKFTKVMYGC